MKLHTSTKQLDNPDKVVFAGLDECGRGALAGPLIAAGVVLLQDHQTIISQSPVPIRDSKKLTPLQRQKLMQYLAKIKIQYEIAHISVSKINQNGIAWANHQAFLQIIQNLQADQYIVDGTQKIKYPKSPNLPNPLITPQKKADTQILQVMIASVIAKVHRDQLMHQLHQQHPCYHWHKNKGYGTNQHIQALSEKGSSIHHRTRFVTTALNNWNYKQNQQKL